MGDQPGVLIPHGKFKRRVKPTCKIHKNVLKVVKINNIIPTKPRPKPRALAFPKLRPGQRPTQAKVLAWPGPAYFGSAWPGFWLQAGAGRSLRMT